MLIFIIFWICAVCMQMLKTYKYILTIWEQIENMVSLNLLWDPKNTGILLHTHV